MAFCALWQSARFFAVVPSAAAAVAELVRVLASPVAWRSVPLWSSLAWAVLAVDLRSVMRSAVLVASGGHPTPAGHHRRYMKMTSHNLVKTRSCASCRICKEMVSSRKKSCLSACA